MTRRIAVILPRREPFDRDRFGAVALTAEAYVRHSAFRDVTEILGLAVAVPRDAEMFRAVTPIDRWWRKKNRGYAAGCAAALAATPPRHIDVHNRVEIFTYLARRFPEAAVSPWFHNDPREMGGAETATERQRILDRARFVFCVSDWVRRRFLDGVARDGERVLVIPEGFDTETAAVAEKEREIILVGRITPEKGTLPFAEALAAILPELPGWRAAIIGTPSPYHPDYHRKVAAAIAPLGDRVAMPGFLPHDQITARFGRAAIAAVPSHWDEAFGRTALEAMAAGCALIASRRGALPEILGDAGRSIEPPDAATMAAAIRELALDDGLRAELQGRARRRAVAEFDARRWSARLDAWRREIDPDLGR